MIDTTTLQYRGPGEVKEDGTLVSIIESNSQLQQFLRDWEAVQELIAGQGQLKDAQFPSSIGNIGKFVVNAVPLSKLNIGNGQEIGVWVVPGYMKGNEVKQFEHNDGHFSLEAATLFRPEPIQLDISQIVVREMKDGSNINPPTLNQYLKNEGVNLKGHTTVELYSAVVFVPVSSSSDPNRQYKTQIMIRASSHSPQWYKPILQGKAYGGPIVNSSHTDKPIDMIQEDNKGRYWEVDPVDAFGELAQQIFGSDTGRLVIVSFPQFYVPKSNTQRYPHLGPEDYGSPTRGMTFGGISATHISAGGSTGRGYSQGRVEIDVSRGIKALSLLAVGVRPDPTKELSLERVLPYLTTGK